MGSSDESCDPQDSKGELHGQNVLTVRYSLELTAARFGLEVEAVRSLLTAGVDKLLQARKQRPKPHLDSKMLAAWNGETALAEASSRGQCFPSPLSSCLSG